MDDLIKRLEEAEEGSRKLDAEIALLLGGPQAYFNDFKSNIDGYQFGGFSDVDGPDCFSGDAIWAGGGRSWEAPTYTASVDDALGLAGNDIDKIEVLDDALDDTVQRGYPTGRFTEKLIINICLVIVRRHTACQAS
jgi:hypothetical protein